MENMKELVAGLAASVEYKKIKRILWIVSLVSICLISGCKKDSSALSLSKVQTNTLYVRGDGSLEAAHVEQFDKEYYQEAELKKFIEKSIEKYAAGTDKTAVVLSDFEVEDNQAKALLKFAHMKDYSAYNNISAQFISLEEDSSNLILPETFVRAEDSATVDKSTVLSNKKCKLIIVKEELDVQVDGSIKYYSNAMLLNNNTVQTTSEEVSVIVFE